MSMEVYEKEFAPVPFGLNNTGAICHFNSLLQALAGCAVVVKTVLNNAEYMARTATGQAFYEFISMMATRQGAKKTLDSRIEFQSSKVLSRLMADLAVRRPSINFGATQESASEGLVLLLDMIEPPVDESADKKGAPPADAPAKGAPAKGAPPAGDAKVVSPTADAKGASPTHPTDKTKTPAADKKESKDTSSVKFGLESIEHPLTRLFLHRYRCELSCKGCQNSVSTNTDLAVQFFPMHIDQLPNPARTPKSYSEAVRSYVAHTEDYFCANCKKKQDAFRLYRLTMIPEIAVFLFKVYTHPRPTRYIPDRLEFPNLSGDIMNYRQVAVVEHTGTLSGGHYTAKCLRGDGRVYSFNDCSTPYPTAFVPHGGNENVYIAFYHHNGITPKAEVDALASRMGALSLSDEATKEREKKQPASPTATPPDIARPATPMYRS